MRVLICTPVFYPSVGGIETINMLLPSKLIEEGLEVTLVTPISSDEPDDFPFKVVRNPNRKELMNLYRWCDVFVHNAPVVRYLFPAFCFRKPFVISHHSCSYNWDQSRNIQSLIKRISSRIAHNIVASEAIAQNLGLKKGYDVIPNFYDASVFHVTNPNEREGFVYVGRLSFEKGLRLLLKAYKQYQDRGGRMTLTIVGQGYEREELECYASELGIANSVTFAGVKRGAELCQLLNDMNTLILPSICKEAFGIVILEALACGCYCIGSDGDGIQESMGTFGTLFRKGDAESLANAMLDVDECGRTRCLDRREEVEKYLQRFSVAHMAQRFIEVLTKVTKDGYGKQQPHENSI